MPRWQPDAVGRLQESALALFLERGYDNTTVADIAERAGLTKRTFFRYFADKREVLFWGSAALSELISSQVSAAPASLSPLEAAAAGFEAAAALLEERGSVALQRQRVIASSPELQERELIKLASLTSGVADALRRRGVGDGASVLVAEAAGAAFRVAFERWVRESSPRSLRRLMTETLQEMQVVLGDPRAAQDRRSAVGPEPA